MRNHQHLTFQILAGDVGERSGPQALAEAAGNFFSAPRPAGDGLHALRANGFGFTLAGGRHGENKIRAFTRELRQQPDVLAVAGALNGIRLHRIGCLIERLGGFEQQGVDGFLNGALAVRFGGQIFKRAGFPGDNAQKGRFPARAFRFGINQFAVLNP